MNGTKLNDLIEEKRTRGKVLYSCYAYLIKYRKNVKDTVRRKTKSCDPMNPPRIVIHSLDAKFVLNICIPAKVSTVNVVAKRNDVYDGRAVI